MLSVGPAPRAHPLRASGAAYLVRVFIECLVRICDIWVRKICRFVYDILVLGNFGFVEKNEKLVKRFFQVGFWWAAYWIKVLVFVLEICIKYMAGNDLKILIQ